MATRIGLAQHADRSQVEADTISYSATTSSLTAGFGSIHGNIHYLESLPYKCTLKRIASTSTSSEAGTVASTCNDSVRCFCLPRVVDPGKFREIADQLGALLMADVAPISALIATSSTFLRSSNPMSSRSLPTRLCLARVRGYSFSGTPRRIQTSRRRSIWRVLLVIHVSSAWGSLGKLLAKLVHRSWQTLHTSPYAVHVWDCPFFKYFESYPDIKERIEIAVSPGLQRGPPNLQIGTLAAQLL